MVLPLLKHLVLRPGNQYSAGEMTVVRSTAYGVPPLPPVGMLEVELRACGASQTEEYAEQE